MSRALKEIETIILGEIGIIARKFKVQIKPRNWRNFMSKIASVLNREETKLKNTLDENAQLKLDKASLTKANSDLQSQLSDALKNTLDADDQAAFQAIVDRQAAEDAAAQMTAEGAPAPTDAPAQQA